MSENVIGVITCIIDISGVGNEVPRWGELT